MDGSPVSTHDDATLAARRARVAHRIVAPLLLAVAAGGLWLSLDLPLAANGRIDAGFLPALVFAALGCVAIVLLVRGGTGIDCACTGSARGAAMMLGGIALFALTVESTGALGAAALLGAVVALGAGLALWRAALVGAGVGLGAVLVVVFGLGVPLPLMPR